MLHQTWTRVLVMGHPQVSQSKHWSMEPVSGYIVWPYIWTLPHVRIITMAVPLFSPHFVWIGTTLMAKISQNLSGLRNTLRAYYPGSCLASLGSKWTCCGVTCHSRYAIIHMVSGHTTGSHPDQQPITVSHVDQCAPQPRAHHPQWWACHSTHF